MLESKILQATQMMKAIEQKSKHARKNPSKEARLLHALKPFINPTSHKTLEDTADMLHLMETMRAVTDNYIQSQDISIQSDGIYDVDEDCMRGRNKKPLT
ncbi:MAG: hypothetical protein FWE21_06425 [Defluviitaleaceae bacterium]|nr:hypothetical protein [Defluviitaleaceae bacterium]